MKDQFVTVRPFDSLRLAEDDAVVDDLVDSLRCRHPLFRTGPRRRWRQAPDKGEPVILHVGQNPDAEPAEDARSDCDLLELALTPLTFIPSTWPDRKKPVVRLRELETDLVSGSRQEKLAACESLNQFGPYAIRAAGGLFRALDDSSSEVRKGAISALISIGPAVIPKAIDRLMEPDSTFRMKAYLRKVICDVSGPAALPTGADGFRAARTRHSLPERMAAVLQRSLSRVAGWWRGNPAGSWWRMLLKSCRSMLMTTWGAWTGDPCQLRHFHASFAPGHRRRQGASYLAFKYAMERLLAVTLLVPVLPIIALVSLLVRMTSRGPAIYRQKRVGLNGRVFSMYKFRTMVVDAESRSGPRWCTASDPRITSVGRFLRQLHLDELPQLFNVIGGEMSIVGPRPERPEFVRFLAAEVEGYCERLVVRPGITGLAQVYLPPDESIECVRKKVWFDRTYIETASVLVDLQILACTGIRMMGIRSGRGARWSGLDRRYRKYFAGYDRLRHIPLQPEQPLVRHGPTSATMFVGPDERTAIRHTV